MQNNSLRTDERANERTIVKARKTRKEETSNQTRLEENSTEFARIIYLRVSLNVQMLWSPVALIIAGIGGKEAVTAIQSYLKVWPGSSNFSSMLT